METFRSRQKNGNIKNINWEELYILTRHWKNDLEFYLEDLKFLQRLISSYSIWIRSRETGLAANILLTNLHRLTGDGKLLLQELKDQLEQLSFLMQSNRSINLEAILQDQETIEKTIADFIKSFRKSRLEAYQMSERIMDSEDLTEKF